MPKPFDLSTLSYEGQHTCIGNDAECQLTLRVLNRVVKGEKRPIALPRDHGSDLELLRRDLAICDVSLDLEFTDSLILIGWKEGIWFEPRDLLQITMNGRSVYSLLHVSAFLSPIVTEEELIRIV